MPSLATLDYVIIAIYLLVVIGVCIRVTKRSPDADELFLASRSLGPWVIGLSLFASNISSTTLIGLPGAAWETGISVANYEWMAGLVLMLTALFVAPVFIKQRISTVPEVLERRFDPRMRKYLSGTSLFLSIVLDTAGSLYAGALVLMMFFPGLALAPTCAAMALFAGIYTTAGGLRAVAYTDVLQTLVLLAGSLLLSIIVFGQFDYSWSQVTSRLDAQHLSLIRPLDDPALPWLGTLIGLPILGFYYWTMNQYVAQRLLGARDADAAGKGALIAAALKLLPLFFMVLPGAMAAALFTDLERSDTVFPRLIAEFAPPGLAGLMLAGLMAAIMSSVDSTLNSASTLFIMDFVKPKKPAMTHQQMATWGRYCTLILMVLAALWAPAIDHFPGLFAYLQQAFAYVTPPLVAAFAMGFCSKKIGAGAAFRGVIAGHIISAVLFAGSKLGWHDIHFTLIAGLLFFVTLVLITLFQCSPSASSPSEQQTATTAQKNADPVAPAIKTGALVLVLLTLALVISFW
ncbi:sodium/solute symporter [Ketobacter sp. MCCC 1A13808]|uniref:sodium:solute symporter family transporter n=1 Tax=Ketobacter sp. MCCC 1A13808 TaxID=2602738 RepID=UPI000F1BBD79|nr:sodium/solute symporter [Ketobacter sp. MCCC 1A13808]MVF12213.1 sodium/solute symporter [Ketobacter sp. MCCC 1A13808]RLP53754.1 MAG: Na+/glucose cotransporter [Ketobacter sp.]